jgi:type I restriction enzyme R subunit
MTCLAITESSFDQAALGWTVKHRLDIASGTLLTDREGHGEVLLKQRLRDTLARLNPTLPAEALDHAFRNLTRHTFVDGVTLVYRHPEPRKGTGLDATARHVSSSRWDW